MLAEQLVAVLVCPRSKQPVIYFPRGEADASEEDAFLLCPASRLRFRVEGGVAVMLVEEADELAAPEVARLVEQARRLGLANTPSAGT